MFKQLISNEELIPLFDTVSNEQDSLGVVVYSPNGGGRSLLSKRLVRDASIGLGKLNKESGQNKAVMVFDSETNFEKLMEQLSPEICPVRYDLVACPDNAFKTADCFLDLLKHNLNVIDHEVGLVFIDVGGLFHLFDDKVTESDLWKGLKEVLLDNDISFVLTGGVTLEFPLDRKCRYTIGDHTQAVLEVNEFANHKEPRYFGISCGIHFDKVQYGELIVASTSDIFHFKCEDLFEEMGFDT